MIVDIRQHIESESFKESYSPKDWIAGNFDYQLVLTDVTDAMIFQLCEWLADNCGKNFVCIRKTSELIAGGSTNNKNQWERRKRLGRGKFDYEQISAIIRLDHSDIVSFRLVWIL